MEDSFTCSETIGMLVKTSSIPGSLLPLSLQSPLYLVNRFLGYYQTRILKVDVVHDIKVEEMAV